MVLTIAGIRKIYFDENRKLHREDGPAMIQNNSEYWYYHGERHRDNGPAMIIHNYGCEYWVHGKKHREDGPAEVYNHMKKWYFLGMLHRVDGPAVMLYDGTILFYIYDERYEIDEWLYKLESLGISPKKVALLKLKWMSKI